MMSRRKKPVCTMGMIVANVLIFFALSLGGMTEDAYYMFDHGAMFGPSVLYEGEYYRMITCIFLHFGFQHLTNNMLTLGVIGRYLEPVVGHIRFLAIYFLSGLAGNALSLLVEMRTQDFVVSAGASGAIFGLTGALLSLAILNRGQISGITKQSILFMIGISLYNGFVSEGVDNMAHIGGLFGGFLVAMLLCCRKFHPKRRTMSNF